MSGFLGAAGEADFARRILVGPGLSGVKTSFPTILQAVNFIQNLILTGSPDAPGPTKKYLLDLQPHDFHEKDLILPDWVWIGGSDPASTRIILDTGDPNGEFLLQFGISGISNIGIGTVNGPSVNQGLWLRDSNSVYSFVKEPFGIAPGDQITVGEVSGASFVVTFVGTETTAALVAAAINAQNPGGNSIVALDSASPAGSSGFLRIGSNLNAAAISVIGPAVAKFGWPSTGWQGYKPDSEDEFRFIDNVILFLLGATVPTGSVGFNIDEISWPIAQVNQMKIFHSYGTGSVALRYPGGVLDLFEVDVVSSDIAFLILESAGISPSANNYFSLHRCKAGDEFPKPDTPKNLVWQSAAGVFLYNTTINEERIIDSVGGQSLTQMNVPYQRDYQESDGITSTTLAAYSVQKVLAQVFHAYPGRYEIEVTFEAKADAAAPVRQCLARVRNSRTADIYTDIAEGSIDWKTHTTIKEYSVPDGLPAGSDDIILEFGTSSPGQAVSIRNARINIWRTG